MSRWIGRNCQVGRAKKTWQEAYSETMLELGERNPEPSDWVRGHAHLTRRSGLRDA